MKIYDIRPLTNKAKKPLYFYTTEAQYKRSVKERFEAQRIIDLRDNRIKQEWKRINTMADHLLDRWYDRDGNPK